MKRRLTLLVPLVIFVLLIVFTATRPKTPEIAPDSVKVERKSVQAPTSAVDAFRTWNAGHRKQVLAPADLAKAVELAVARRQVMSEWIVTDPALALRNAISWSDYEALPKSLKPYFEQPFNAMGSLRVLPVCGESANRDSVRLLEIDGRSFSASVFGWRVGQGTKEATPLAGITLDGRAAISEAVFETLSPADAATVDSLPLGNRDAGRDFATGASLGQDPVIALAGGRRFLFANAATITAVNEKLAVFDQTPGPHGGSRMVFAMAAGGDGAQGISWEAFAEEVQVAASAWTETPKSVFFIRVDFSDQPGTAVTQTALAEVLNTQVADSIEEMSYGKTTINATVSSVTVRMPKPKGDYLPSNNDALYNDAVAAYLASPGATALTNYQIVGVHFPSIGISSGGLTYAGLATLGGSRQWLQGTSDSNVIIHEFGHNYDLGHASFWSTNNGTVVGAGSSVEYGDPFDIMGGGSGPEGHFHMQGKQRLNWLEATQWTDASVSGSGTYRVYRFDDPATTGALRGVRVTKVASPAQYYWLGYRPGIPGNPWLDNGAYLLWQREGENRSWLLDTTPGSDNARDDAALSVGATYSDASAGVHITPLAVGGSGADAWLDVNVQIGGFPGNLPPTATLNAPASATARSQTNFTVTAADPNNDVLSYSWDFGSTAAVANSASVSHSWTVGGTYTVKVTVSDMKGGSITRTQVVVVNDPLETWTAGTVAASRTMSDVAYLDGRFIAAGGQYAYLSLDGSTWTEQYLGLNFGSGGIAWNGTKFVIAGYDWNGSAWYGTLYHSSDGKSWTAATVPATVELRDVVSGGGVFVAVGDDGAILRSTDGGATWTSQVASGVASLAAVAYGNGGFVAVGEDAVYTSTDGMTWLDRSAGSGLASWQSFRDVIFHNGSFIAGGWYSGIKISADGGVTWSSTQIAGGADYEITAFAAGGGAIVATGNRLTSPTAPVLLVSKDGEVWEESGVSSYPDTESITHGDGVFLTVHGAAGASVQSAGLYPLNNAPTASITAPATGNARESVSFSATTSDADGNPLVLIWDFQDGTPLAKGPAVAHTFPVGGAYSVKLTATDTLGGVTTASHAITIGDPLTEWIVRTSGTTSDLNDIVFGGGKLVVVGTNNGTYRTSVDGITWTGGTVGNNIQLRAVIHDGSRFIAVGSSYNFSAPVGWTGAIYTSPDGVSWTRRYFAGSELFNVAHAGGNYIAVGNAGRILRSTDSISWTPVSSGISQNLGGVAYGEGGFV
ncbi:MAG: PKD domain-containing protein, partial [Akkermansiaceae bacterium]|nr:PKD domain-containing protein [Akkermansiaceae bacterium]